MVVKNAMNTNTRPIRRRRRYDDQFKRDAVDRVIRTGKTCREVAEELGIRDTMLARWRMERLDSSDQSTSPTGEMKPSEVVAALQAARRELEDMREQRDILKKALNIFSQQRPSGERR